MDDVKNVKNEENESDTIDKKDEIPAENSESEEIDENKEEETDEDAPFDFAQLLPDKMEEIILLQIMQLKEWAHIHMGFIPHPKHKKVVKDMKQAKISIDCAGALTDAVMPYFDDKQKNEIKIMMSDLKMNYISHASQ